MRTAHIITRLIIGGAQENTLYTVDDQQHLFADDVCLITGPGLGPEGSLEQRARDRELDLRVLPELVRRISPVNDVRALRSIMRQLREFRPEIVHTHSSKAGILGRLAAARLGIPAVHTIHGAAFHYGQHPLLHSSYRLAERLAARWCDHFISVCDAMTNQYLDAGIGRPDQFTTVYSGMDVEAFQQAAGTRNEVRSRLGLDDNHLVFGKIARLFGLKGHNWLIEAAPQVVRRFPHARFLLVGDGILRAQYEQRIAELGLRNHFLFTGLVPPTDVPTLIHAMDVVVHTSDWEGLPRVLPQGLLAGKPVIAFNRDGSPEVCRHEQTGLLVAHTDIPGLADAMCRLADSQSLRSSLGAAGTALCAEKFCHRYMTEQIRKVYQLVLDQRTSSGSA